MIKDGRLFGKFNFLDLLLVLILIGAAAFVLSRGTAILPGTGPESSYTMRFFVPLTYDFVVEHVSVGDAVSDHNRGVSFGTITHIDYSYGLEWNPNSDGVLVASHYQGQYWMEITTVVTLPAGALNNGLHIQGNRFGIGQTVVIRAGDSLISLRISGFEENA